VSEWAAPAGLRRAPEGLAATFAALRMRATVDAAESGVSFEASRRPGAEGAALAAVVGAAAYLALRAAGMSGTVEAFGVVAAGALLPPWILPSYLVKGRIAGDRVSVEVSGKGLLARPARLEEALRFYL
jgi:hypothetical protein